MKRPWQVWLTLAACGFLVTAAMGWLTVHARRIDRERSVARAEADLEQRVSLALWRMDTKLAPLIAEESARPHFYYAPFITVEAPREGSQTEEQVASPLMTDQNTSVVLNFDASLDGQWRSPQAPPPELTVFACSNGMTIDQIDSNRQRLAELQASINVVELLAQLPEQPVPGMPANWGFPSPGEWSDGVQQQLAEQADATFYGNYGLQASAANAEAEGLGVEERGALRLNKLADQAQFRGKTPLQDLGDRSARFQTQVGQEYQKQRQNVWRLTDESAAAGAVENLTRPLWVGDRLMLARRVVREGSTVVQGSWLDWPKIKSELLAETADLLPDADLAAVRPNETPDPTRMLAGLPVRLIATSTPMAATSVDPPLRWALSVGWAALVLALAAVAALLWGVLALSERRAAFVSSVTHELRTPLTTFRMYAEMLVRDMVPSPERRLEYLQTLRTEAERLTHLVDNVLAYARLERGRTPQRTERATPATLADRFESRLAERAGQAEMTLEWTIDPDAADAPLLTDVGVVEQILFNLVDNAAKYAGRAEDRRIQIDVTRIVGAVAFTVRDHGPGFASLRAAERSAPFSKSAEEAAGTAPGVGLGLALCRRLARELGGRLELAATDGASPGAAVTLHLPTGE